MRDLTIDFIVALFILSALIAIGAKIFPRIIS